MRPDIFKLMVQKGWMLLELRRDAQSLEDVFKTLTKGDERKDRGRKFIEEDDEEDDAAASADGAASAGGADSDGDADDEDEDDDDDGEDDDAEDDEPAEDEKPPAKKAKKG